MSITTFAAGSEYKDFAGTSYTGTVLLNLLPHDLLIVTVAHIGGDTSVTSITNNTGLLTHMTNVVNGGVFDDFDVYIEMFYLDNGNGFLGVDDFLNFKFSSSTNNLQIIYRVVRFSGADVSWTPNIAIGNFGTVAIGGGSGYPEMGNDGPQSCATSFFYGAVQVYHINNINANPWSGVFTNGQTRSDPTLDDTENSQLNDCYYISSAIGTYDTGKVIENNDFGPHWGTVFANFCPHVKPNCAAPVAQFVINDPNPTNISGNYTVPRGIYGLIIECWGRGGHGDSGHAFGGFGGGGGGYVKSIVEFLPGDVLSWSINPFGTIFGPITAYGGGFSSGWDGSGGDGGGNDAYILFGSDGVVPGTIGPGGKGGNGANGGGGFGAGIGGDGGGDSVTPGSAGGALGGGGGGGWTDGEANTDGGLGGAGLIRVTLCPGLFGYRFGGTFGGIHQTHGTGPTNPPISHGTPHNLYTSTKGIGMHRAAYMAAGAAPAPPTPHPKFTAPLYTQYTKYAAALATSEIPSSANAIIDYTGLIVNKSCDSDVRATQQYLEVFNVDPPTPNIRTTQYYMEVMDAPPGPTKFTAPLYRRMVLRAAGLSSAPPTPRPPFTAPLYIQYTRYAASLGATLPLPPSLSSCYPIRSDNIPPTEGGIWIVPAGVTQVLVVAQGEGAQGADGASGDGPNWAGGVGGGGGAYVVSLLNVLPGQVYTLTVGAGGTGTDTTFIGPGGTVDAGAGAGDGTGGIGSGDYVSNGQNGVTPAFNPGANGGGAGGTSGNGTVGGPGGAGNPDGFGVNGSPGHLGSGGGGGGGGLLGSSGGAGSPGYLTISWSSVYGFEGNPHQTHNSGQTNNSIRHCAPLNKWTTTKGIGMRRRPFMVPPPPPPVPFTAPLYSRMVLRAAALATSEVPSTANAIIDYTALIIDKSCDSDVRATQQYLEVFNVDPPTPNIRTTQYYMEVMDAPPGPTKFTAPLYRRMVLRAAALQPNPIPPRPLFRPELYLRMVFRAAGLATVQPEPEPPFCQQCIGRYKVRVQSFCIPNGGCTTTTTLLERGIATCNCRKS